jgi:23S rRNA pseudouridine2457 synthase
MGIKIRDVPIQIIRLIILFHVFLKFLRLVFQKKLIKLSKIILESIMSQILLFNKPYNVMCQFTDNSEHAHERENLSDYISQPGFYAAGRLDRDSEGLLLLTNDGKIQQCIADPKFKLPKTYLVQVEGDISKDALKLLQQGVQLKDGLTRPANVVKVKEPLWLWSRTPPIRERKNISTSWIELTIKEGKNRQVRRMTAATGYPTLRLIRIQIGPWKLDNLAIGEAKMLSMKDFKYQLPEAFFADKPARKHRPKKTFDQHNKNQRALNSRKR